MRVRTRTLYGGCAALLAAGALVTTTGGAASAAPDRPSGALTLAVFGDSPYGTSNSDVAEFRDTPAFIDRINADPDVSRVVHVGDIHSGKQFCTESYDRQVAQLWTQFADPLVYTPGDNEWTDCHKPKEGGGTYNPATGQVDYVKGDPDYAHGNPVDNLALLRRIFFPQPGTTLGAPVAVRTQADQPGRSTDRDYVENVLWSEAGVTFVTVNIPGGSNNDADPWYGAPQESAQQKDEREARTAADLRWLDVAFASAQSQHSRAVVVLTQADMWDLDGGTQEHLAGYEPFVKSLARHTNALHAPVLLINGDSHGYRSDNPFDAGAPCTEEVPAARTATVGTERPCDDAAEIAATHPGYTVPQFHRIVVHGSTAPLEWLKLTVSAQADGTFGPFSWRRQVTGLGG